MINFLLAIFVPLLLGVLIWILARNRGMRKTKPAKVDHQSWRERAVWGWATVVNAASTPVNATGRARVSLTLEVHTPGTPAYTATTTWLVEPDSLGYVEVGKEISLKVDPLDLRYVYPNGSWAKVEE
jgi:hypothetical protein